MALAEIRFVSQKMSFHYLRIASDLSGLIGSFLIFFYGVPRQIDTGGKVGMALLGEDKKELEKIKRYKFLGNTGIIFIGLSFILMLIIDVIGK